MNGFGGAVVVQCCLKNGHLNCSTNNFILCRTKIFWRRMLARSKWFVGFISVNCINLQHMLWQWRIISVLPLRDPVLLIETTATCRDYYEDQNGTRKLLEPVLKKVADACQCLWALVIMYYSWKFTKFQAERNGKSNIPRELPVLRDKQSWGIMPTGGSKEAPGCQ